MDKFFPKARCPNDGPTKRPRLSCTTSPNSSDRATTPEFARLSRPLRPPPIKKKIVGLAQRKTSIAPELNWSNTMLD